MFRYVVSAQLRFRGNARRGQQESGLYEWNLEISEMFYQYKDPVGHRLTKFFPVSRDQAKKPLNNRSKYRAEGNR